MSLKFPPHPGRRPVFISGASSGIGEATAIMMAQAGYPVAVGARRAAKLDDLVARIKDAGGEAVAVPLDVSDTESVDNFFTEASAILGDPDIVVSGAGELEVGRVWEMDTDTFAHHINVHLIGAQRILRAVLPGMIERRRGDVVLIGSDVAQVARPRSGAYCAAKAGLEHLGRQTAKELEGSGVRCGIVRPGPVKTAMGTTMPEDQIVDIINDWSKFGFARHPRLCMPADLARGISTMVTMPRGAAITELEVQPEGPIEEEFS